MRELKTTLESLNKALMIMKALYCSFPGGINSSACVAMLKTLAKKSGVEFRIAEVTGDDLMAHREALEKAGVTEMFSGKPFLGASVNSMNAYYGAGPILNALNRGADIVVTGEASRRFMTSRL